MTLLVEVTFDRQSGTKDEHETVSNKIKWKWKPLATHTGERFPLQDAGDENRDERDNDAGVNQKIGPMLTFVKVVQNKDVE